MEGRSVAIIEHFHLFAIDLVCFLCLLCLVFRLALINLVSIHWAIIAFLNEHIKILKLSGDWWSSLNIEHIDLNLHFLFKTWIVNNIPWTLNTEHSTIIKYFIFHQRQTCVIHFPFKNVIVTTLVLQCKRKNQQHQSSMSLNEANDAISVLVHEKSDQMHFNIPLLWFVLHFKFIMVLNWLNQIAWENRLGPDQNAHPFDQRTLINYLLLSKGGETMAINVLQSDRSLCQWLNERLPHIFQPVHCGNCV